MSVSGFDPLVVVLLSLHHLKAELLVKVQCPVIVDLHVSATAEINIRLHTQYNLPNSCSSLLLGRVALHASHSLPPSDHLLYSLHELKRALWEKEEEEGGRGSKY